MIGDEVYIEDLGSTNRTTVNREEIDSHRRKRLRINDVVRIGGQRLVLTRQADAEPEIEDRTRTSRVIPVTRARAEAPRATIEGQVLLADTQPVPARRQRPRADWRREPPRAVRATSEAGAPARLSGSSWLLIWIAMATAVAKLLGMVP